jgi:hypothetical protein
MVRTDINIARSYLIQDSAAATFWLHRDFQDRMIWLWEEFAKHYKGNTWYCVVAQTERRDSSSAGLLDITR